MLVLQAWEPSLPPWLDPLLLVLALLPAARAASAHSSLVIIKLAKKEKAIQFLFDFSFFYHIVYHLSNLSTIWSLFQSLPYICFTYFDKCTLLHMSFYCFTEFVYQLLAQPRPASTEKTNICIPRSRCGSVVHFFPSLASFFSLISHCLLTSTCLFVSSVSQLSTVKSCYLYISLFFFVFSFGLLGL